MNSLVWHPPYLVDNTDTLDLGTTIDNSSDVFLDFSKQSFDFFLIYLNEELALGQNSCAGRNYLQSYYDYYLLNVIAYLIILELATMNPLV